MSDDQARTVVGTYRKSPGFSLVAWGAFSLLQAGQALLSVLDGRPWPAAFYAISAAGFFFLAWTTLSECTVVSGDGLRVKRGFRWRALSWDQVTSVAPRTQWRADRTLTVRIHGGEVVLHVPATLREEFIAYAAQHRRQQSMPTNDAG